MSEDPVVTETRLLREEMMVDAGNDLDGLFDYLQKEQENYRDRLGGSRHVKPFPFAAISGDARRGVLTSRDRA